MATSFLHHALPVQPPSPRRRIAFLNMALESAWRRGWATRPTLDPEGLIAAARRSTGLDHFGHDSGWRDRLDVLTGALHGEASLNAVGQTIAHGQIVAALANRLRLSALWNRHEEIGDWPLVAPIIVVGQMRSGSTRVQRLLACDDRLAHTRFFESWNPAPRWRSLPFDDRRLRGSLALLAAKVMNPQFGVIHPTGACAADEEIGLHNIALYGSAFEAQWRIPSYVRRGEAGGNREVYREFRRHLQTIGWLRGRRDARPWILKVPQFTQDLGDVLSVFPDARIIVLNRDPADIVGSSASLVYNQMVVQSDRVDRSWIGREWVRKTALRSKRTRLALARSSHARAFLDYEAVEKDWRREMAKVYAMLGMSFTSQVQQKMARFLGQRSHARLCRHRYDLAEFGLSAEDIRDAVRPDAPLFEAVFRRGRPSDRPAYLS